LELEAVIDYLIASENAILSSITDWIDFARWYLDHPIHKLDKNIVIESILSPSEMRYTYVAGTMVNDIINYLDYHEITTIYNKMHNKHTTNFMYIIL